MTTTPPDRSPAPDDTAIAEIEQYQIATRERLADNTQCRLGDLLRIEHQAKYIDTLLSALTSAHREIAQMQVAMNEAGAALDRKSAALTDAHRERDEMRAKTLDLAARMAEVRMNAVTRNNAESFAQGWRDACVALAKAYRALSPPTATEGGG